MPQHKMTRTIAAATLALGLTSLGLSSQGLAQSSALLPGFSGSNVTQAVVNTALNSGSALVNASQTAQASRSSKAAAVSNMVVARSNSGAVSTGRSRMVFATAYNSEAGQTDGSPFITATGTRTRPGVLAVSRDLLRVFPYGSRVRLVDTSGRSPWLSNRVFIVEDTMNARFTNRVDLWMGSRSEALNWGGRNIQISAVQ